MEANPIVFNVLIDVKTTTSYEFVRVHEYDFLNGSLFY